MSRMVKLTDEVGGRLEEYATSRGMTMARAVSRLLEGHSAGPATAPEMEKRLRAIDGRLDGMGRFLKEQFDALESIIKDTTVDRVEQARPSSGGNGTYVPSGRFSSVGSIVQTFDWEDIQAFRGTLDNDSPAWYNKRSIEWMDNSDALDEVDWRVMNGAVGAWDGYRLFPVFKAEEFLKWKEQRGEE